MKKVEADNSKTCTLMKLKNGEWKAVFNPGLPYDRNTKGMPHKNVLIKEATIQNSKTYEGEDHYLFHGMSSPNYIYRLIPTGCRDFSKKTLIKVIEKMGWKVIDTEQDIAKVAASKLSKEELKALLNCGRQL